MIIICSQGDRPRPSFILGAASLAAFFALAACGPTVTASPEGAGGGGAGAGSAGEGGAAATCTDGLKNGGETGVDCGSEGCPPCATTSLDCASVCANIAVKACYDAPSCEADCKEGSPAWSEAVSTAFIECATDDPLCFTTLESCMLEHLYPGSIAQDVKLEATGFHAYEGHLVHASFEAPGGSFLAAKPQQVLGGAFAFAWTVEMPVDTGHLILYYIDVDKDEKCSPNADLPGSADAVRPPGFELPSWSVTLKGPSPPAGFVCDYI